MEIENDFFFVAGIYISAQFSLSINSRERESLDNNCDPTRGGNRFGVDGLIKHLWMFALLLLAYTRTKISFLKWQNGTKSKQRRESHRPSRTQQRRFLMKASANGKIFYANQPRDPNRERLFGLPTHTTARKVCPMCIEKRGWVCFSERELCQCQLYHLVSILFFRSLSCRVAKTSALVIATREIKRSLLKIWKSCPRKAKRGNMFMTLWGGTANDRIWSDTWSAVACWRQISLWDKESFLLVETGSPS